MNHKTIQNHKRHADKAPLEESPSSSWPGPAANDCSKALVGGWGDSGAHVTVPFVGKEAEASQAEDESTEAETD